MWCATVCAMAGRGGGRGPEPAPRYEEEEYDEPEAPPARATYVRRCIAAACVTVCGVVFVMGTEGLRAIWARSPHPLFVFSYHAGPASFLSSYT